MRLLLLLGRRRVLRLRRRRLPTDTARVSAGAAHARTREAGGAGGAFRPQATSSSLMAASFLPMLNFTWQVGRKKRDEERDDLIESS